MDDPVWASSAAASAAKLSAMLVVSFLQAELLTDYAYSSGPITMKRLKMSEDRSFTLVRKELAVPLANGKATAPRHSRSLNGYWNCRRVLVHLNKSFARYVANGSNPDWSSGRADPYTVVKLQALQLFECKLSSCERRGDHAWHSS